MGAFTINADQIVKQLLLQPHHLKHLQTLVPDCFDGDVLDQVRYRKRFFSDQTIQQAVEAWIHPIVRTKIMSLLEMNRDQSPYQVIELPIVKPDTLVCDRICYVDSDTDLARKRLLKRWGEGWYSQVISSSQDWTQLQYHDKIINNGDDETLRSEVMKLNNFYRNYHFK
tara:strand:- start:1919 stop:2425 length:507 start_codon:yes stop_codon:yes gene_type:complete